MDNAQGIADSVGSNASQQTPPSPTFLSGRQINTSSMFHGTVLLALEDYDVKVSGAGFNFNSLYSFINPRLVDAFNIPKTRVAPLTVENEFGPPIVVDETVNPALNLCGLGFKHTYHVYKSEASPFLTLGRLHMQYYFPCLQVSFSRLGLEGLHNFEFDMCVGDIVGEDGDDPYRFCRIVKRYSGREEAVQLSAVEGERLRNKNYEPDYIAIGSNSYYPCPLHFNHPWESKRVRMGVAYHRDEQLPRGLEEDDVNIPETRETAMLMAALLEGKRHAREQGGDHAPGGTG